MAVLSLPLTFNNSFWTEDYRKGLEVLFHKLEQGVEEDDEIVAFIRARAIAEGQLAASLIHPSLVGPPGTGFSVDDGASLLMAFRGLAAESVAQGNVHKSISNDLHSLVADPFDEWAQSYKERLSNKKETVLDGWIKAYEQAHGDVAKLKHQYLAKTRKADEAEDDARFAPGADGSSDKYTSSPRLRPADAPPRAPLQRAATVSERIANRLKELQRKSASKSTSEPSPASTPAPPPVINEPEPIRTEGITLLDKGKGKAVDIEDIHLTPVATSPQAMSPLSPPRLEMSSSPVPPMEPPPMLLAGLSLPPAAVSQLLSRASSELPLRAVRFPLLGEYQNCFTGEEFVTWLMENVAGFGGSIDRAEDAARDLAEREGLLRRVGEFGNQLENADDAWYQFRPKAFELGHLDPGIAASPIAKTLPQADNLVKKTSGFVNLVSKALQQQQSVPTHVRARQEAEEADKTYRVAIRKLDRHRLGLEEKIEETLKLLQRWEAERLRTVKDVLLQYQGTLANLPKSFEPSLERSGTLVASYNPESDLNALIERYRTGPFRPDAQIYESLVHDEPDVLFGLDLRKWAEGGWFSPEEDKNDSLPPVLEHMLGALDAFYGQLPSDDEKRKSWIYEVPLPGVHHLREALNATVPEPIPTELWANYDAPTVASCVKLWLLELDPPLSLYEGWDEIRKLYPTVGQSIREEQPEQHLQELGGALQRLPRIHLFVLDAIIKHLKDLIDNTKTEESDEVYITKLALSIGRSIIRPKFETELSIQDRHPTLLIIDLLTKYDKILPPTIARKKRESERKVPIRKRTAPIDMRMSRSRLSVTNVDPKVLLAAQQAAQSGSRSPPPVPPVPPLTVPPPPPLTAELSIDKTPTNTVPPPPPVPASDVPKPPAFKEPPPEDDEAPARPEFKEPKSESEEEEEEEDDDDDDDDDDDEEESEEGSDDDDEDGSEEESEEEEEEGKKKDETLPMPKFPEPKEEEELPMPKFPEAQPASAVQNTLRRDTGSRPESPRMSEDEPIAGAGRVSLTRSGSSQSQQQQPGVRGPRISRGPRAPGGNVGNMVANLNRSSISQPSPPTPSSPQGLKRLSIGSGSSVLGKAAAFQSNDGK